MPDGLEGLQGLQGVKEYSADISYALLAEATAATIAATVPTTIATTIPVLITDFTWSTSVIVSETITSAATSSAAGPIGAIIAAVIIAAGVAEIISELEDAKDAEANAARFRELQNRIDALKRQQTVLANQLRAQLNAASKLQPTATLSSLYTAKLPIIQQQQTLPSLGKGQVPSLKIHTVKPGETLSGIAQQYGTSTEAIWKLNKSILKSGNIDLIYPKENILIPYNANTAPIQQNRVRSPLPSKAVSSYQWSNGLKTDFSKMLRPTTRQLYVNEAYKNWEKQITFKIPASIKNELKYRNAVDKPLILKTFREWKILDIENAMGSEVNLDYYPLEIDKLPINPITNKQFTKEEFLDFIRIHYNFFSKADVTYNAYSTKDETRWEGKNPVGAAMKFQIGVDGWNPAPIGPNSNPDDLTVICTEKTATSWIFSTAQSPQDAQHTVSGNREFGIQTNKEGKLEFYTRGADRLTGIFDSGYNWITFDGVFSGADALWNSVLEKISLYINTHQGVSKLNPQKSISKRHTWNKVVRYE